MLQYPIFLIVKMIPTLLVIFLLTNSATADIYVYVDQIGNQHFSEHKVNDKYQLLLRSETNKLAATFKNWKEESKNNISMQRNKALQDRYHGIILKVADRYQLEPEFLHAVITAESSYRHRAVSASGAQGLMQLMPTTAQRFGVNDPFDPKQSITAGALYLKKLLKEFKSKKLALAAYNAGEGTVRRYNKKIPPFPETKKYVEKVMEIYWYYKDTMRVRKPS